MVAATEAKPITLFKPGQTSAKDAYGREMTYLRISLTDRCNFRCLYCMPAVGMKFQPRDEMLSDEELIDCIGAFSEIGFTKFRLTGGEPTIRPHLVEIVRAIKQFPNVEEITMTTNALLLGRMAEDLAAAGMNRINVSLDTLNPERFKIMTRGGRFDMVWDGIQAAERAGMTPIKINTVVIRGQNEHDVVDLAKMTLDRPWQMRFLEIMPMEGVGPVYDESLVTSEETQLRLEHTFGPLEHIAVTTRRSGAGLEDSWLSGNDRVHLADIGAVLQHLQPGPPECRRQTAALSASVRRGRSAGHRPERWESRRTDQPDPGRDLAQAMGSRHSRGRLQHRSGHVANRRMIEGVVS